MAHNYQMTAKAQNSGKPPLVVVQSPKISNKKQKKGNMLIE